MTKNTDGSNRLIGPGEKCLVPTDEYFWKDPRDIRSCMVKTRSCTRTEPTVSIKDYHTISLYVRDNGSIDGCLVQHKRTIDCAAAIFGFHYFIYRSQWEHSYGPNE